MLKHAMGSCAHGRMSQWRVSSFQMKAIFGQMRGQKSASLKNAY